MATVDQILERVRVFARTQSLSKTELARQAGLPDTTLRDLWQPGWSPTVATLRRLEAVIPEEFDIGVPSKPRYEAVELPERQVAPDGPMATALALWREWAGVLPDGADELLGKLRVRPRTSKVYLGEDNRLRFRWQGTGIRLWRDNYHPRMPGLPVAEQRSPGFGQFVDARLWRAIESGEPLFQACRGLHDHADGKGPRVLRWHALILPMRMPGERLPTLAYSVTQVP